MARLAPSRLSIRSAAVVLAGILLPMVFTAETVANATDTMPPARVAPAAHLGVR